MTVKWPLRRSLRSRLRVRLIRTTWMVRKKLGRCRHEAPWGPAGGNVGQCAICGVLVNWEDDE